MARRRTKSFVVTLAVLMMVASGLFSGAALAETGESGDDSRALEQAGLTSDYLCVSRFTGEIRLSFTASCSSGYTLIQLSTSFPFDYCYSIYTRLMSDDRADNTCPPGTRYVVVDGLSSFAVCLNRYTRQIYHTTPAAGCSGGLVPVFFVDLRGDITKYACVEENLNDNECDVIPGGGPQNEIRHLEPVVPTPFINSQFRLEFRGEETGIISASTTTGTSAAAIQAALESLSSIGVGNVSVTAVDPGEFWTTAADVFNTPDDESTDIRVEFTGALGNQDITDPINLINVTSTSGGEEFTLIDGTAGVSPGLNNVMPGGTVQIFQATGATDPDNPATYGPEVTAGPQPVNAAGSYTATNLLEGTYVVCATGTGAIAPSCELATVNADAQTIVNNVDLPGTISAAITDTTGVNEVQSLTQCSFGCSVIGGTFTITFDGQTTTPLAANATTLQVDAALEALSNIGVGNVSVTGQDFILGTFPGQSMSVEFTGALGGQDVPEMTVTSSLTGAGFALGITVATTTEGSGVVHTLTADNRVSGGTFTLTYNNGTTSSTTGPLDWDATVEEIEIALNALASINGSGGSVTVVSTDPNFVFPEDTPITKAPVEVNFSGVTGADTNVLVVDNTNLE